MKYLFPENFYWGGASSALQTEGSDTSRGKTTMDKFFEEAPTRFYNGMGPGKLSNFYENYAQDIALLKKAGLNSLRFSISWARLIPGGRGEADREAVEYYNRVIDEFEKNGIELFMNLHHFDLPIELQNEGGFESRDVVEAYVEYARTCFQLFGKRIKKWCTFNEPIVTPEGGYLYDFHYPNVVDFKRAVQVAYNMIIAHSKAVAEYRKLNLGGEIFTVLNITPIYPRSSNEKDMKAAKIADLIFVRSFLDPFVKGEFNEELKEFLKDNGLMPETQPQDKEIVKNNIIDFLGLNYYQPRRVKAKEHIVNPDSVLLPESFFDYYDMQGKKMNTSRGWEIYPKAIYDMLMTMKNEYNNFRCFIAENGMGVQDEHKFRNKNGVIEDDYRIQFFKEHLSYVHKAIQEGSSCFGYHMWTPIDNWSMINEYKNRYGLIEFSIESGNRQLKKSGLWFNELSKNNGFDD